MTKNLVFGCAVALLTAGSAMTALASPSGKFEPVKCSFNGSQMTSCSVLNSYINRAGGWMVQIKGNGGRLYVFRQEDTAAGDPFRDSSNKVWAEAYDNSSRKQSFFNPNTNESIVIQYK